MAILEEAAMIETPGMGMGAGPDVPPQLPVEQEVAQLLALRDEIDQRLAMLTGGGMTPAVADPAMAAAPMPAPGLLG